METLRNLATSAIQKTTTQRRANDGTSVGRRNGLAVVSDEDARRNRAEFLLRLRNDLRFARRLEIPDDFLDYLRDHFDAIGYSSEIAERARLWILYGDWTFRGKSPELFLSDFFPTDEQVRAAYAAQKGGAFVVIPRHYLASAVDTARAEGYELARRESIDENRDDQVRELQRMTADAKFAAADAIAAGVTLAKQNDEIRRELEKVRRELHNLRDRPGL